MDVSATLAPELSEDMMAGLIGGSVFGATLAIIITIVLVLYIIQVIAYWRMFKKMGEPGWKSIIPAYNGYILYKRTWKPMWFWVNLVIGFVAGFLSAMIQQPHPTTIVIILSVILLVASIVLRIMTTNKISKSFGHGVGFTVGLIFLPVIFTLILGFGSSQYKGADL